MKEKLKIGVLFGGRSTEHSISCRSACSMLKALDATGHSLYPVGISKEGDFYAYDGPYEALLDGSWLDLAKAKADKATPQARDLQSPASFIRYHFGGVIPDVIIPCCHGINCEDGVLQGFLEMAGIPYVGAGVLASALGMDKAMAKIVFGHAGIPQVPYVLALREEIVVEPDKILDAIEEKLAYPVFLKPSNGGSSVGTMKAQDRQSLLNALAYVSQFDRRVLVEAFVDAREVEVAVKGNLDPALAQPGEIVKDESVAYYDYETKYLASSGAKLEIPAHLPQEILETLQILAAKAYRAIGCTGLCRVDFFLDKEGQIYLNEVNTMPGFTSISLYPQAWAAEGQTMAELLEELCFLAIELKAINQKNLHEGGSNG